jgi:predicted SAM-dependent methyltransferase
MHIKVKETIRVPVSITRTVLAPPWRYLKRWQARRKAARLTRESLSRFCPLQLELGSATPRPGWVTIDLARGADLILDLTKPLPFSGRSVDKIYSSHLLEHICHDEAIALLKECHRILKAGGTLSVCVPDASIYLNAYCSGKPFDIKTFCFIGPASRFHSRIDYVNYIAYMGGHHKHMYDKENLIEVLRSIGFQTVTSREFDADLDSKERAYESTYALAVK